MQIKKITFAVTNMDAMVTFYNNVFDTKLTSFEGMGGFTFYEGILAGIPILFCPNELPQVEAKQNRQQFEFLVDDIQVTIEDATEFGGASLGPAQEVKEAKIAGISDPDGNTIELRQEA